MPLPQRKALLTLCQVQRYPIRHTRTRARLFVVLREHFVGYINSERMFRKVNLFEILRGLSDTVESPVLSGLLSMLVRTLPFLDMETVEDAFLKGRDKELLAAMEEYRPKTYNWNVLFTSDKQSRIRGSIHPSLPIDKDITDVIHTSFCKARFRLSHMRLYPSYSHKTIGREARRNLAAAQGIYGVDEHDIPPTTFGLEKLYHHTGMRITGPTEIRWAWTFNILKPRLYYARGPDQYYDSRYIQAIFNVLVDSLPVTHRLERFFTTSMHIDRDEVFIIYDYESFTSKLDEIRNFTTALADFLRGYKVEIVDTYKGVSFVDLGDIMDLFNDACNMYPEFDTSGAIWDKRARLDETCLINHTCGMLGVPGNISSCTLLHGLHLIHVVQSLACKVVGDDAAAKTTMTKEEIVPKLQGIGSINIEKVEAWEEEVLDDNPDDRTWHYVKRPIDRLDSRVFCGTQAIWPSAAYIAHHIDEFHSVIYPPDLNDFRKRVANMLCAFCRQFRDLQEPDERERQIINRFIRWAITKSGLSLKNESGYEVLDSRLAFPIAFEEAVNIDVWLIRIGHMRMRIPEFEYTPDWDYMTKGVKYRGRMSRSVKLARDLGYANVENVDRSFFPRDYPGLFKDWFLKTLPSVQIVDYVVLEDCPEWIMRLIRDENQSYDVGNIDTDSDYSDDEDDWL